MQNWTMQNWIRRNCLWMMLAGVLLSMASAQSGKIVFIDMDKAFDGYNQTKSADVVLKAKAKEFGDEKDAMVKEYETVDEDYNKAREDTRNPIFSEEKQNEALDRSEKLLLQKRELESRIRQFEADRKRQMEENLRRTRKRLVEDIREVIQDYARSRGIAGVIDSSGPSMHGFPTVIYSDESADITEDIVKLLNEKNP